MAVTVEYIIILTGFLSYGNVRIARIHINKGYFILFDENGKELYVARRMPGIGPAIISGFIPYLSYGTVLRFVISSQKIYAVDDMEGQKEVECTVEAPTE